MSELFTVLVGKADRGFGLLTVGSCNYPAIAIPSPSTDSDMANATFFPLLMGMKKHQDNGRDKPRYWYFQDRMIQRPEDQITLRDLLDACKNLYPLPLVHILDCDLLNGDGGTRGIKINVQLGLAHETSPSTLTLDFSGPPQGQSSNLFQWTSPSHEFKDGKLKLSWANDPTETIGFEGLVEITLDSTNETLKAESQDLQIYFNRFVVPFDNDLLEIPIEPESHRILKFSSIDFLWNDNLSLGSDNGFCLELTDFAPKLSSLSEIPLVVKLQKATNVNLALVYPKPALKADISLVIARKQPIATENDGTTKPFTLSGSIQWYLDTGVLDNYKLTFDSYDEQNLDIDLMALCLPEKSQLECNFCKSEIKLIGGGGKSVHILVPGALKRDPKEMKKRFVFDLKNKPNDPGGPLLMLRPAGISFYAELTSREVQIGDIYSMQPLSERNGIKSVIELKDSAICQASFFAMMPVPGFNTSNANAKVMASLALRQNPGSDGLSVHAELELDRKTEEPIGEMSFGFLEAALDRSTFILEWTGNDWKLDAKADGRLSLTTPLPPFLAGLSKENPLSFVDLSLTQWSDTSPSVDLNFSKEPSLGILDGLFTARWTALSLSLSGKKTLKSINCKNVTFSFNKKGAFDIEIMPGELGFTITESNTLCLLFGGGKPLGIKASIGDNVMMVGEAQWIEKGSEKGIGVSGHIEIEGLPAISALMFIGTGRKYSGEIVPNICIYAAVDLDVQLYPGVYLKSIGLGVGINRCLSAVGLNPSPLQLLERMGDLDPGRLGSWSFVPEGGTYLSLIGTLTIAAVAGDKQSPFVLWMLLCLDSNGVFTAAGKLWLASSVKYTRDNFDRPAVVASMVVIPQRKLLQLYGTTRANPAIQNDPGLAKILNSCSVKFSYIMSPSLMDYFIEDASFATSLLGANAKIKGDYRFAITAKGALMRAGLVATADLKRKLSGGACGASFEAQLTLAMQLAGLIDELGAVAYAKVAADMRAHASLWVRVNVFGLGSKTYSKSTRLNVSLAGVLAFDHAGDTGFVGSAEATFSLCGFRASVDASLSINEGMVRKMESRIVAFERQVNKIRQQVTESAATQLVQSRNWQIVWHQIESHGQPISVNLLVVPTGIGEWYGGFYPEAESSTPIWRGVQSITVQLGQSQKTWEVGTYAGDIKTRLNSDKNLLSPFDQLMLTACVQEDKSNLERPTEHWLDAILIQDPRLQAGMRSWWREEDQLRLRPGVHPIDLRPIEEIEAAGLADSNFEDVVQFELCSQRSRRIGRHGFNRLSIDEQHRQIARGWVVQQLVEQLDLAQSTENSKFPAPMLIELEGLTKPPETATIKINYTTDEPTSTFDLLLNNSLDLCGLETCTPRQRTVLVPNPTHQEKLSGFQQVQLPIRFALKEEAKNQNAEFLIGSFLRSIRGLRLLRRLPGELEPSVIAEELQIPFRWLSVPKESSGPSTPGDTNSERPNSSLQKYLVLLPSIYEDRFYFNDYLAREGTGLVFTELSIPNPVIEYFLEPIPVSAALNPVPRLSFPPIPLQPIEPEPSLHDLVVVIPHSDAQSASQCLVYNADCIEIKNFQLVRGIRETSSEQTDDVLSYQIINSHAKELRLGADSRLELWAEELPGVTTGYYGRCTDQGAELASKKVNDIAVKSHRQSNEFKVLVGTYKNDNDNKLLFIPAGKVFRIHSRYRFFLRRVESFPKLPYSDEQRTWYGGLLTPVAFAFGRFWDKSKVESSSLKFFPWFEVPQFNQKQLLPATFNVHFDPARDHNTLVIEIGERPQVGENLSPVHPSTALAAVEILIRDLDEPQRCVTLERELLSQTDFLLVERDFRNASLWESVGADLPSSTNQQSPTSLQPNAWYDETKNVEWLNLHNQLTSLSCETWREAFGKLRSLYASIYQYQQTSTFVNSYAPNWERLALAVRLLMAGCKVTDETNPNQLHSLPKLSTNWNSLLDLIREVESIDGEDLEEKELDEWLIKLKLVSILRHRLEIGQEIFGSEDDVLVVKSSDIDQEKDVLPLQTLFNEALGKVNIIDKEFSGKVSGLVYSPLETVNAPWWNFNWLKPTNTADGFKVLDDDANVQACVPHLTGLAVLIRKLKSHLQRQRGWRLVKRPHNTVQTVINSSGMRVAVSTPASQLLPERLADSTDGSTQANFNAIPPIFLANILERLGFAVDLAAYDSLGQQIPGVELHHEIASYVHKDPESRLFVHVVWLPVENRGDVDISLSMSSYGQDCQPQPQSYGFLKLAVLSSVLGTHPSDEHQESALEEVVKNRMVDLKTSGTQPNLTEVIRDQINKWSSHPARLVTIPVRPRGQRVQTLCLHAGVARCYWIEVDLKRHRYAISVNGISRYAPLERWLNLNPNASGEPASQDQRSHDQEVEIVTQRHLVPTDEQLSAPTVYPRSDPHRVIFSYSLPAEGQRSLLNHLSAIRTGWHGVETQWLWRNPWLNQTPDSFKSFNEYCDYIHDATGLPDLEYQSPPELSPPNGQESLAIISNQESLFRGERFMIAHYLPYCLEYDLRTRTVYEGLCGEWSSPRSAWIRRLPVIPLKSQDAVRIGSDKTIFKLIYPSDLMTANEIEVLERFKAECSQDESSLWIGDIPDPEMVYRLYLKQPQLDGKTLYRLLDTVQVPFAQGLPRPTEGKQHSKYISASEYEYTLYRSPMPVARYYLGFKLDDLFGDVGPPPAATSNPLPVIVQSQYKGICSKLGSS